MNYIGLWIMALGAGTVWGGSIPLVNHSFEQPQLGTEGQDMLPDVPGWKVSGKTGVFANIGAYGKKMAGAGGNQMAFLNGTMAGGFTQDLPVIIQPGMNYSLSALIGLREDSPLAKGSSLFLRVQEYDTRTGNLVRTLAFKEIVVGTDALSNEVLTNFSATFISGDTAPKGSLRVNIAVGKTDGDGTGDWTIDNVHVGTFPVAGVSPAPAQK